MTFKEKTIKFINKILNFILRLNIAIRVKLNIFPTTQNGILKIVLKGYDIDYVFNGRDFTRKGNTHWGSIVPDSASVFYSGNSILDRDFIKITTEKKPSYGLNWKGEPEDKPKPTRSGLAETIQTIEPKGIYAAKLELSKYSVGSWDAWWLLAVSENGNKTEYQEIDMYERFYTINREYNQTTTSVHSGASATKDRGIYNSNIKFPKNIQEIHVAIEFIPNKDWIKIYYNGVLGFMGLQWKITNPMLMIINSCILEKEYNEIKGFLAQHPYYFTTYDIIHYTK